MQATTLLTLNDMWTTEGTATVQEVLSLNEKISVILDQSWFYPQGGGQPYDQGWIQSPRGQFQVTAVRFVDGIVHHIGNFTEGQFQKGDPVTLTVDKDRRTLMSRNHSGGHVIDLALARLGIHWKPVKGYHFPEGPYVEYEGVLPSEYLEQFRMNLEDTCQEVIQSNPQTRIAFMDAKAMQTAGFKVPNIAPEKPLRLVYYGDFAIPCGGTHVHELKKIGAVKIRKIKQEKDHVKIAYTCIP